MRYFSNSFLSMNVLVFFTFVNQINTHVLGSMMVSERFHNFPHDGFSYMNNLNLSNFIPYNFKSMASGFNCDNYIAINQNYKCFSFPNIFSSLVLSYKPNDSIWVEDNCKVAMKKYFCSLLCIRFDYYDLNYWVQANNYSIPKHINLPGNNDDTTKETMFYLPSFPHSNICNEYSFKCSAFISVSNNSALTPKCSEKVYDDVLFFPVGHQTVHKVRMLNSEQQEIEVSLKTSPNMMSTYYNDTITTTNKLCPKGFVVPNYPDDPDIKWVNGTGCALACKSPIWTDFEWYLLIILSNVFTWTGLPLVIILIITWTVKKDKRKQYLVLCFAFSSLLSTIIYFIPSIMSFDSVFCRNNAVGKNHSDGGLCAAQALILVYTGQGCCFAWAVQSIDLFIKVVLGKTRTDKYSILYLSIIFILPIPFLIAMGISKEYGYYAGYTACFVGYENSVDIAVFYLPTLSAIFIGSLAMFSVIGKITRSVFKVANIGANGDDSATTKAKNKKALRDMFKMVRIPALFVLSFFVLCTPIFIFRFMGLVKGKTMPPADMDSWIACVFTYFDGTDTSWQLRCGYHPEGRLSPAIAGMAYMCESGNAVLISSTYLCNPSVWLIWLEWLGLKKASEFLGRLLVCIRRNIAISQLSSRRDGSHRSPAISIFVGVKSVNVKSNNNRQILSTKVVSIKSKKEAEAGVTTKTVI